MKSFIFIFLTYFCFYNTCLSEDEETQANKNKWFLDVGAFLRFDEPSHHLGIHSVVGGNLTLEKVINDNFSIYSEYYYAESMKNSGYASNLQNKRVYYDGYLSFHSLSIGSNWYIVSSDINNRFTPYIGAGFMLSYSYDTFDIDIIESKSAVNIAYVPSLGLNIPILGNLGLRFEMKYIISIYDFELVGFDKRDINFIEINLGLKYAI